MTDRKKDMEDAAHTFVVPPTRSWKLVWLAFVLMVMATAFCISIIYT